MHTVLVDLLQVFVAWSSCQSECTMRSGFLLKIFLQYLRIVNVVTKNITRTGYIENETKKEEK